MNNANSRRLFAEAVKIIPGGVNSPVRAFGSVGGDPRFIARAEGAKVVDADGNAYIDYVSSWGPMILGHNDPHVLEAVMRAARDGLSFGAPCEYEVRMAEAITRVAPIEMVRMVNSGTEAVMSALRLARGYTGRDKVIKFAGCYHGQSDGMLVKAGSGAMTGGIPDSAGVTAAMASDTLTAAYNDLDDVESLFKSNPGAVAALIVEPVAANMGVVLPKPGFLKGLRDLCDRHGALLIFDEVITGFRLGLGGAQTYFGVRADLATYGKIIGGGMPVGAYGGRKDVMKLIAPSGPVYQAGTLSGNPVAMAAGLAQLKLLQEAPEFYEELNHKADVFFEGMQEAVREAGKPWVVNHIGSLGSIFFTDGPVTNYAEAKTSDTAKFGEYFSYMIQNGIYLAPSQFEAMFLSAAMTEDELEKTLDIFKAYLGQR